MNRDQLKEALTGMGVSFANNAGTEKLQALYDEALAAKAAGGTIPPGETAAPEGNSGPAPDAEPAASPAPAPAGFTAEIETALADDEMEEEISIKVAAGLKREQAIEVIRDQRKHDRALAIAGGK